MGIMANERLSWQEAEKVVQAWRVRQGMRGSISESTVSVSSLASALDLSEDEIRGLRDEVRAKATAVPPSGRRFADRSGWLSMAVAGGVAAVLALVLFVGGRGIGAFGARPDVAVRLTAGSSGSIAGAPRQVIAIREASVDGVQSPETIACVESRALMFHENRAGGSTAVSATDRAEALDSCKS